MRGEDLIVVVRWQEARFARRGKGLLATHHNGVSKTTQQHHNRHDDIHDTEAFMVDGGQPLFPQVGPLTEVSDQANERQTSQNNASDRNHDDRFMERDCIK